MVAPPRIAYDGISTPHHTAGAAVLPPAQQEETPIRGNVIAVPAMNSNATIRLLLATMDDPPPEDPRPLSLLPQQAPEASSQHDLPMLPPPPPAAPAIPVMNLRPAALKRKDRVPAPPAMHVDPPRPVPPEEAIAITTPNNKKRIVAKPASSGSSLALVRGNAPSPS